MSDTIFALATGPARAAVAVVRISGPGAQATLEQLASPLPSPRRASLRRLRDPALGDALDEAIVLWFPAPGSFTGEDQAELHLHGGRGVVDGVLQALAALGLRPARPGEFTRRAFEHGRLDLSEAEAVADLIDAETASQRRQALAQLGGALGEKQAAWRETILHALALLEAATDFADEDLPPDLLQKALGPVAELVRELRAVAQDRSAERIREGYRIALVGPPNVGKSSLLNALCGREAAIVTALPGTTRDVIEVPLVLAGVPVLFGDTAGLRDTDDPIEAEGVRRGRLWADSADLRLYLSDKRNSIEQATYGEDFVIHTKADLYTDAGLCQSASPPYFTVSSKTKQGLEQLSQTLSERIARDVSGSDSAPLTRVRHRRLVEDAIAHLERAVAPGDQPVELVSENLRLAARALERLTGRIDPEAVLDRVFSTFCIGK